MEEFLYFYLVGIKIGFYIIFYSRKLSRPFSTCGLRFRLVHEPGTPHQSCLGPNIFFKFCGSELVRFPDFQNLAGLGPPGFFAGPDKFAGPGFVGTGQDQGPGQLCTIVYKFYTDYLDPSFQVLLPV